MAVFTGDRSSVRFPVLLAWLVLTTACLVVAGSSWSVAMSGKPDLVVSAVGDTAASRSPGQTFSVSSTVKNAGAVTAARAKTGFFLSTDKLKSRKDLKLQGRTSVPTLSPGAKSASETTVTIPTTAKRGLYYVIACADIARKVTESKELNNCKTSKAILTRVLVQPPPPAPSPLTVDTTADNTTAVTKSLTPDAAAVLQTTGSDGTTYTLRLPAGALPENTDVTMTPLSSLDTNVFSGGLTLGVELEPSGLQLVMPATLTITPADPSTLTPPAGMSNLSFAYGGTGDDFHLFPDNSLIPGATTPPGSVRFTVEHFSGYGSGQGTPDDQAAVEGHFTIEPQASLESRIDNLALQYRDDEITSKQWGTKLGDLLITDFVGNVLPAINRALSAEGTAADGDAAWSLYTHWGHWMMVYGYEGGHNVRYNTDYDVLNNAGLHAMMLILQKFFEKNYQDCMSGAQPAPVMMTSMLRLAHVAGTLGSIENILGADYFDKINECGTKIKHTWAGTIHYTWSTHGDCTGTCQLNLTEGSGTLNLHFTEEQPGNQTWLPDGGDYSATAHYRTETAGPQCTLVDDGHEATSGPLTEAEALYLSEYKNNTYAYLGFDVSKYVDDNIIRTNSDCSTDEFVAQHQYAQFRAAHGDCPQLPRADGDPASGLRASKTTQDGHLALDFTCNDTVTTGGSTTTVQVSGTLVESP